jgi:uncharacterized protein (DUF1810 family)
MTDPFDLQRFLDAQVVAELRRGQKQSHWMWFVFPQLAGLGHSAMAQRFAIASREEAVAYLGHGVLGFRLKECTALAGIPTPARINTITSKTPGRICVVSVQHLSCFMRGNSIQTRTPRHAMLAWQDRDGSFSKQSILRSPARPAERECSAGYSLATLLALCGLGQTSWFGARAAGNPPGGRVGLKGEVK